MAAGVRANSARQSRSARSGSGQGHSPLRPDAGPWPVCRIVSRFEGSGWRCPRGTACLCRDSICWISRVPRSRLRRRTSRRICKISIGLLPRPPGTNRSFPAIAEVADVLPARFGIEFLNDKSLRSHIDGREAALKADFNRIRGKEEWGVKVFALPVVLMPKKKVRTGKEYLQAKSAQSRRMAERDSPELLDFAKSLRSMAADVAGRREVRLGQA